MKTNDAGIRLIKQFEGFRKTAYYDTGNVLTIGYGHTNDAKYPVFKGQTITDEIATEMLKHDLVEAERGVTVALGDAIKNINENQFAACVSLAYNIGNKAFAGSSICTYIKLGKIHAAAERFGLWIKDNGRILQGLVNRRAAEKKLYLS